jgi:predicted lipoprotein with Yx(FWY)xxD motif
MRVKTLLAIGLVVALALVGTTVALAADHVSKRGASTLKISTRTVPGLGKILVDHRGRTLYMFVPDKRKKVTCHGTCAKAWPPLFLPAGAKFAVAGGVKKALLGSDKDSSGGRVVTYNHWPLYFFVGDRKAGVATGQALDVNGGLWYVMSASGAIIKHKASAGSGNGGGTGTTSPPPPTKTTTASGGGAGGGSQCSDDDGDGDGNAGGPDDGDGCI